MNHTYIYLAGALLIVGLAICPLILPKNANTKRVRGGWQSKATTRTQTGEDVEHVPAQNGSRGNSATSKAAGTYDPATGTWTKTRG